MEVIAGVAHEANNWASAAQSVATVLAIVVGAVWAYFKFIKDRVYRPRMVVSVRAGTIKVGDTFALLCSVTVKNIGTSKIGLVQRGTGVRLYAAESPSKSYVETEWTPQRVYPLFAEHAWIESGETVQHDTSISLGEAPGLLRVDVRLVCRRSRAGNLVMYRRAIIPPDSTWNPVGKEVANG